MPSPIAHSVSGYALSRLPFVKDNLPGRVLSLPPLAMLYGVFVSNMPDLDFLPQILTGIRLHRGPSHSLLAAVLVSLLLSLIIHGLRRHSFHRPSHYVSLVKLTFIFYSTHLLMDLLTSGGSGLPLLWPLSNQGFQSPITLFPSVHHSRGLWDISHLIFIGVELIYTLVLFSGIRYVKARRCSTD